MVKPVIIVSSGKNGYSGPIDAELAQALGALGEEALAVDIDGRSRDAGMGFQFRGPGGELDVTREELLQVGASGYAILDAGTIPLDCGIIRIPEGALFVVLSSIGPDGAIGSYSACKVAIGAQPNLKLGLIVTAARSEEAIRFADKLNGVLRKFLGREIELLGALSHDPKRRRDAFTALARRVLLSRT